MFRGQGARYSGAKSWRPGKLLTSAKGLFADNIWHCDCAPRLPAEHFKVKKEGKNHGRWFYTCQQPQDSGKRCDFFLWDEDAKPRMEAAVLSNRRTEQGEMTPVKRTEDNLRGGGASIPGRGLFARTGQRMRQASPEDDDNDLTASPSPSPTPRMSRTVGNGTKRNAYAAGMDDEDLFGSMTEREEAELARVADAAAPVTPHKAQKTGVYATPATSTKRTLPWLVQPMTSTKANTKSGNLFETPSRIVYDLSQTSTCTLDHETQPETPTNLGITKESSTTPKNRYKDALINPADSASSLTSEALATLSSTKIPPQTLSNLRGILSKHDLRTQGVIKGRDISRLALKAKDAKIAELQSKIASMEAEREVDRAIVRKLKWEADHGGQSMDEEL